MFDFDKLFVDLPELRDEIEMVEFGWHFLLIFVVPIVPWLHTLEISFNSLLSLDFEVGGIQAIQKIEDGIHHQVVFELQLPIIYDILITLVAFFLLGTDSSFQLFQQAPDDLLICLSFLFYYILKFTSQLFVSKLCLFELQQLSCGALEYFFEAKTAWW